jgi:hypothetical protein
MSNIRTFYACQAVAVCPILESSGSYSSGTYNYMHGVQSVGLNSSFDIENLFELGQLEIYDTVLNVPEIEITIEKVLDGYKTVYGLLSSASGNVAQPLSQASKNRASVKFALYPDTQNASTSGYVRLVECTGMYLSNVTYTIPVDGNITESVTLVGNHKQWYTSGSGFTVPDSISNGSALPDDRPVNKIGSEANGSGIFRRQHVTYNGPGKVKAQNITLTLNLSREDVFEFGRRIPYAKIATYPIETTVEIESLAVSGNYDDISFTEDTSLLPDKDKGIEVIIASTHNSGGTGNFMINTGSGNFLTSITHTGGDATGGNATVTRSYTSYNAWNVLDSGVTS